MSEETFFAGRIGSIFGVPVIQAPAVLEQHEWRFVPQQIAAKYGFKNAVIIVGDAKTFLEMLAAGQRGAP